MPCPIASALAEVVVDRALSVAMVLQICCTCLLNLKTNEMTLAVSLLGSILFPF